MNKLYLNFITLSLSALPLTEASAAPLQAPKGYCIIDIATVQDPANNVFYKWGEDIRRDGVQLGYPINYWDVPVGLDAAGKPGNGYMNLSALIDKIESGKCLSDVRFLIGQRGTTPPAPNSISVKPWVSRGSWVSPHVWQPGGNGALNGIGIIYTLEMDSTDPPKKIVTGIESNRSLSRNFKSDILAAWKPEGGGESYYTLYVHKQDYVKPLTPPIKSIAGRWEQVSLCHGCKETGYQTQVGVTKGHSVGKETETSKSLSLTLGSEVGTGEMSPVQVKASVSITGTIGQAERRSIVDSFETAVQTQRNFSCEKGALWQWVSTLTLTNATEISARSDRVVCTTAEDNPPSLNRIDWKGKNA